MGYLLIGAGIMLAGIIVGSALNSSIKKDQYMVTMSRRSVLALGALGAAGVVARVL